MKEKKSQLPLHQLIKEINLDEFLWVFDAASIFPSALWSENSIYPRIENGCA